MPSKELQTSVTKNLPEKGVSLKEIMKQQTIDVENEPMPLSAAPIVGLRMSHKIASLDPADLPSEFQGQEMETIDPSFPPSVKWTTIGNTIVGVLTKKEMGVGPNNSELYFFKWKNFEFTVWETTIIKRLMEKVDIGDLVRITYVGDVPTDQNPCKMFGGNVVKPKTT